MQNNLKLKILDSQDGNNRSYYTGDSIYTDLDALDYDLHNNTRPVGGNQTVICQHVNTR